jgi:antitoxin ParD1/3/4
MNKNVSLSLDEHYSAFVDEKVAEGRYESADDVIRAGLRLLEEEDAKVAALRAAIIEGEESGEPTEFDFDAFLAEKRKMSSGQ